jgi:hypothetical protein
MLGACYRVIYKILHAMRALSGFFDLPEIRAWRTAPVQSRAANVEQRHGYFRTEDPRPCACFTPGQPLVLSYYGLFRDSAQLY